MSDFRRVNASEAYDELFRYFKFFSPFYKIEDDLMKTLGYIDVKNFAHRITCLVKMTTDLEEVVCYPITQFAISTKRRRKRILVDA